MIAAVLCGGKGTRLRPVIGAHQKCAVDVGGRPWIHRVLDLLAASGEVEKAVLLTGYKADEIGRAALSWMGPVAAHCADEDLHHHELVSGMLVSSLHSRPFGPDFALRLAFERSGASKLLVVNGDTMILGGFVLGSFVREFAVSDGTTILCAPALLDGVVANAGIVCQARPRQRARISSVQISLPYLDIGTPAGLAEARRRFAK